MFKAIFVTLLVVPVLRFIMGKENLASRMTNQEAHVCSRLFSESRASKSSVKSMSIVMRSAKVTTLPERKGRSALERKLKHTLMSRNDGRDYCVK